MTRGYVPCPVPDRGVKGFPVRFVAIFSLAVVILFLAAMSGLLLADESSATPAPSATGKEDFGQYLADHQDDLAPFFSANAADICRLAVPMVMGLMGWVTVITLVVGWAADVLLSRAYAYFFAPAFAEIKRSIIYATGGLFLSFIYLGLLTAAVIFCLKLVYAGVVLAVVVPILVLVAVAAQVVWILYLYRTTFAASGLFYVAIVLVHTILFLLIAQPVVGFKANSTVTDFIDQVITSRMKAEAEATRQKLAAADSDRNSVKAKVADLQNQLTQAQADAAQLSKEIDEKKNSDLYVFSQIIQARARGELASAHEQLTAFLADFPTSSMNALARAQLAEISTQMVVVSTQKKHAEADATHAAAAARADLLARAARGEVTLSEMRQVLIGKSRADVKNLLGLPMDTGTDSWGYRQQMILNPLTNEKHGLTVYFSEGTVQGVDYDRATP
jgi:hypothetical protein